MPGVKIGDGAIIAARSVVSKDVMPYTVVGGSPIQLIRKRFDDETIELLQKIKWWDFDKEKLLTILPLLCNTEIENFADELKKFVKANQK